MGSQLGPAVAGEYALVVERIHAEHGLAGLEIAQVPYVLAHHVWLALQQPDVAGDHLGLVLLAEHLRRLGVVPG